MLLYACSPVLRPGDLLFVESVPEDFAFAPGDSALYCSELVQECFGSGLFPSVPMNFNGPDGLPLPYWAAHFEALGLPVPQGTSGTNPNDLSRSPHLRFVRSLP